MFPRTGTPAVFFSRRNHASMQWSEEQDRLTEEQEALHERQLAWLIPAGYEQLRRWARIAVAPVHAEHRLFSSLFNVEYARTVAALTGLAFWRNRRQHLWLIVLWKNVSLHRFPVWRPAMSAPTEPSAARS